MDIETKFSIIRQGKVTNVDASRRMIKVTYTEQNDMTSGWLYVLQHQNTDIKVEVADNHTHTAKTKVWMPAINDRVLVLVQPMRDGDGFVLGAF